MKSFLLVCLLTASLSSQEYVSSISEITPEIFLEMPYSWKDNNPVPLEDLRLVSVSYWGFDDQVHQGAMIFHKIVAEEIREIFEEIFDAHFPIEKMVFVDVYQVIDERSAEDNNSYSFCSRAITMGTAFSLHSYGLAVDLNPVQNPYLRGNLLIPNNAEAYLDRTEDLKGMILPNSVVYNAFIKRGWDWGGDWMPIRGYVDYQHFDKDPEVVLAQ